VLSRPRGLSIIEIMFGLVIVAMLLMMGLPAFTVGLQNFQLRTAAESVLAGLQVARMEALRRNASVRFQLVDSLDADCNMVSSGPNWVVSRNDPTAACDQAAVDTFVEPNDLAQPQILQKRDSREGSVNVALAATSGGAAANSVIFTGLGRVAAGSIDTVNVTNPVGGVCEHVDAVNGKMRCLRILVGRGGQVMMCDPKVTDAADSRYCQ